MSELEIRIERLEQNVQRINERLDNSLVIPNRRVRSTNARSAAPLPEGPPPRSRRPRSSAGTGSKKKKHKKLKKTKSKKNKKSRRR